SLIFIFTAPATTHIYTLSLHDALPISTIFMDASLRGCLTRSTGGLAPTRRGSARARSRESGRSTRRVPPPGRRCRPARARLPARSEEHTSELQSLRHLVCRLLLEKKNK